MSAQPEALRLAEKMESYKLCSGYAWHCHKAAAELRRLHEVNAELLEALYTSRSVILFHRDIVEGGANAKFWSGPLEAIEAAIAKREALAQPPLQKQKEPHHELL